MGISNEWELIDELTYITESNIRIMTAASVQKIASAIGWEVVNLGDYVDTITLHSVTVSAKLFNLIRPPAEDNIEYNTGVMLFYYQSYSNWDAGQLIIELSTGRHVTTIYPTVSAVITSCFLLRPTSNGGFAIRYNGTSYALFDKFYNPKTEETHWGIFCNTSTNVPFCDLFTGLTIQYTEYYYGGYTWTQLTNTRDYIFCAIKKFTAISSDGVFNATTFYQAYADYSNADKTIELNGIRYRAIKSNRIPFYLPLAE